MIIKSQFSPAWWLPGPHAQTIYPTMFRQVQACINQYERVELPDGDFIDLAWATKGLDPQKPLVILLHGLGGSLHSKYIVGQISAYNKLGWRVVFMHFRGASQDPNRLARVYHSGETNDLNFVINLLHQRAPLTPKALVGFSLGGNVLLKWLGENPSQNIIHAAAAISVPFELKAVSEKINQGFSKIYQAHLLKKMRRIFYRKAQNHTLSPLKQKQLHHLKNFYLFDEHITAPIHGFKNAEDYYLQSSSKPFLKFIKTPTLIIHAIDDPFMTPKVIPNENELSSTIQLELTQGGGHVGFITGKLPGMAKYWLDMRIPEFLIHFF